MRSARPALRALALTLAVALLPLGTSIAQATSTVTVTAPASLSPGDVLDLRTMMPVSSTPGTISQSIQTDIDPTKVKLTAATDIIAPNGWTVEYSTNGTNFTPTAPVTPAEWAAVRSVRATGSVQSLGSANGYQVAQGTATGAAQSTAPAFIASSGTGDGFEAFFDPGRTRVFNVNHHEKTYPITSPYYQYTKTLDCHVLITGATCAGFPYYLRAGTHHVSLGKIVSGDKLWVAGTWDDPADSPNQGWKLGFECIDLAAVIGTGSGAVTTKALSSNVATLTTGKPHGLKVGDRVLVAGVGSPFDGNYIVASTPSTTTFTYARTNANIASAAATGNVGGAPKGCATPWVATGSFNMSAFFAAQGGSTDDYNTAHDLEGSSYAGEWGSPKLWTIHAITGALNCVDTATYAPCSGMPDGGWAIPWPGGGLTYTSTWTTWDASIEVWDGRVYVKAVSKSDGFRLTCVLESDPTQSCPGFTGATSGFTAGRFRQVSLGKLVELPAADGSTRGVCLIGMPVKCLDATGAEFTAPASLRIDNYSDYRPHPVRVGTRITYGDYYDVYCWDAAGAGGAGAGCFGGEGTLAANTLKRGSLYNYTMVLDPEIPDCGWIGQHPQPTLRTINLRTGQFGTESSPACGSLAPSRLSFSGSPVIPRMACNINPGDTAIREWRRFTLTNPSSGFTSVTLTVRSSSGASIPGWTNVPLSASSSPPYSVDLSTLPVSATGQNPSFLADLTNAPGVTTGSAVIQAVGSAPELCVLPLVLPECNQAAGLGPVQSSLFQSTSVSVTGTGSANPGGALGTDTESVAITAPTPPQCGSTLTGRATDGSGGAGNPVAGAAVSLLDDTGNAILDDTGNPITALTDSTGAYSFGYLKPGSYKVRFASSSSLSSVAAQTASGDTGSDLASKSAVSGTSTSGTTVLAVGTAGVVNGQYVVNPVARPNTSTGAQGAVQTVAVLADDSASTGATYSGGLTSVKLCTGSQVAPNCTGTSLTVTGQGTYAVSGNNVTFTPCSANNVPSGIGCTGPFTGVATPATYQSTDSLGRTASSTLTPTVVPVPLAVNDSSTGTWNTAQTISPLANDLRGNSYDTSYPLRESTMGICAGSTTLASSCTGTTALTTADGTYSLNTSTGVVTFTPSASFTGVVTAPIKYAAADSLGQRVIASITPTVTPPPSPTAASETKAVAAGSSVSFTTVTGSGGLGTSGGPSLITTNTTTGTGLCPVGTVLPGGVANCTLTSVTVSGQGTYTLDRTTGIVTYSALAGASTGSKTPITYLIRDGLTSGGRTNWASGELTPVIPGPPVARDDTAAVGWDVTQSVNVLGNDSADPGQSLVASSVRLCGPGDVSPACDDTVVTTAQGTYTVDVSTGAVSFDPLPTFWGTAPPITYTVTDTRGLKDPATLTVTVAAPGPPVAGDDTAYVGPGTSGTFDPLMGAGGLSSSGGPALSTACLWVSGACDADGVVTVNGGGGVYVLDPATNIVTFHACTGSGAPHASCTQALSGQVEQVSYRVTDAVGQTDTGVLTARVPVAPVSRDDSSMAEVGATQVITPLGNDQAGDAGLDVSSLKLCAASQTPPQCDKTAVTTPAGTYTVSGGAVTFVPSGDTPGTDVPVTYQVSDIYGQTSDAVIRVTQLPKPAPRATPDALSGPYGQSLLFTPLSNDSFGTVPADDSTSNVLTQVVNAGWLAGSLKLCGAGEAPPNCAATTVTTVDGTYVISGNDVTFTGNATFTGVATQPVMYQVANTYTVRVTDYGNSGAVTNAPGSKVGSSTLTPTITIAPVAVSPDTATTPWNTPVTRDVLADDTSGAPINAGALKLCGPHDAGVCAQTSVTVPGKGTYEVVPGGVRFTPMPSYSGPVEPVAYRTTDTLGRSISSTFTPAVTPPAGPTALPETKSVLAGASVSFTTLSEAGPLVAPGVNSAGTNAVQNGSTCLIEPGSSPPTCDADGTVSTVDGIYVLNSLTGIVTYTADPNAPAGAQTPVSYRVVDSIGLTASASLTPSVYARPWVPAEARTDIMNMDQALDVVAEGTHDPGTTILGSSVRLCTATDTAPDCTGLTRVLTGVGVFRVDPSTGVITFNPDDTYVGPVPDVTYSVEDGLGQRASATLTLTVVSAPRPVAVNDTGSANTGSPVVFRPWSNDDTIDGPRGYSVTSATLVASSIRLCGPGDVALPSGAGCDDTTVVTVDGTYVLDELTGEVTFTHAPGFTGAATFPVAYQITTDYQVNGGVTRHGYATAQLIPTITATGGGGGGSAPSPGGGGGGGGGTPPPGPAPVPTPDQGLGRPGDPVRVDPIGNDTPGQGQQFDEGSLRLCGSGATPPDCSSLVVSAPEGTWVVDPFTGGVVFTPAPGFKGLVEIPYVVDTEDGLPVDSVISIWITDPPTASDDASTGRTGQSQTLTPLGNDTHDAAPWVPSSLALCGAGQTPPACDQSRVQTPDGVYVVDPVTGKVAFTPAPGFTGTATPVQYQVADAAGQVATAWLRPAVRGSSGGEGIGWVHVRKVVTGNDLRAGAVKIVTTCADRGESMRKVHRLPVEQARGDWRVEVPAGMRCEVEETAHGAPDSQGVSPTWDARRWKTTHAPTIEVGESVDIGTAVPIDRLILSVKGGCQIRAGELQALAAGTCIVTWRALDGQVTTNTRWTHTGPRGTKVESGTLTRGFAIRGGAETTVTFHNLYRAQDQVVTRTVYVAPQCPAQAHKSAAWAAPWASPEAMAAFTPRGGPTDPGGCPSRR